jgi:hypothetical protein
MEPEVSLSCLEERTSGPNLDLGQSNPSFRFYFLNIHINIIFRVCLGLPGDFQFMLHVPRRPIIFFFTLLLVFHKVYKLWRWAGIS